MSDLTAALVAARAKMTDPKMSGKNPHFGNTFVPRDEVLATVVPALLDEGVFLSQGVSDGALLTVVSKGDDVDVLCEYPIPAIADPQKYLASLTYASRGSLMLAFSLAGEPDDDGNTAAKAQPSVEAKSQPAPDPLAERAGKAIKTAAENSTGDALLAALKVKKGTPRKGIVEAFVNADETVRVEAELAAIGAEEA